jgi:aryl-alcohol dehydrogenase-like predicted oxidoreductase
MQHRNLGQSNLELPVVTFGAWAAGGLFWGGTDDDETIAAIQAGIDAGMDAIDTAPAYGCGHSEEIVGRAIRGRRDRVKLLTKCGLRWDDTSGEYFFSFPDLDGGEVICYKNARAASIAYECEQSLKRLATDAIDLYQVHWPSATAPAEETMGVLCRLREQGKIREIGVSNYSNEQLADALRFGPVVSNQVKYNLLERAIEADTLPWCRQHNLGVICYSPMALGILSGKVGIDRTFPTTDLRSNRPWYLPANRKRVLDALEKIRPIADGHGLTLAQFVVAWVIAQPGVTTALVGARNARQATENARCGDVTLGAADLTAIREVFEALGSPLP